MEPSSSDRAGALFHRALAVPAGERAALVHELAADDAALAAEVLALLAADRPETAPGLRSPWRADTVADERVGGAIGPYVLGEELGEGGMGRVYRAEQQSPLQRVVAVKVMKAFAGSANLEARFQKEIEALQRLQHRGIARVLDCGRTPGGRPFLVMEHVPGVPLHRWRQGPATMEQRLDLLLDVCEAVQHAHGKGVIHRDLKPSNVLVVTAGERAEPRVIDFGIAAWPATTSRVPG